MRSVARILALTASLVAAGCSFSVPAVEPRPNVALPARSPSFALSISDAIPDAFDVESQGGVSSGSVEGWRVSIQRGFDHAFAAGAGKAVVTLELEMVDLEFVLVDPGNLTYVPTGRYTGVVVGSGSSAQALVSFRGRWRVDGREIPFADTARSKGVAAAHGDFDDAAESALETMYEMAAKTLLAELQGPGKQATAPATVTPAGVEPGAPEPAPAEPAPAAPPSAAPIP